ncbi:MAG: glycosyltransferase family 39 protein [Candidatus Omnitrophica bacterium]|nr:glycosyltransferase family 39 protein [Candidatus Omnitrophota bacterium]
MLGEIKCNPTHGMNLRSKLLLFIIVLFSFSVIFYASTTVQLNGPDEEEQFLMASRISFAPSSLHLPLGFPDIDSHPLLTSYFVKLGFLLFGKESIVGGRFLSVLLGSLGILLIFLLVNMGINLKTAFLSIIFLSVEKCYSCRFRCIEEDCLVIFFSILATYVFFKALKENSKSLMLLTGVVVGVGLYAKETVLLLLPIYFIYLCFSKNFRFWIRKKELYYAGAISLFIFTPFIIFNLSNDLYTMKSLFSGAMFGLSPIAITALFGEFFSYFIDKAVIIDIFDCEYPLMHWISGMVVLAGVIYSAGKGRGSPLIKLLLIMFSFNFILFSVIMNNPMAEPNSFLNNTDWPSMMVVPGIILGSYMLVSLWNKKNLYRALVIIFIVFLGFKLMRAINLPETFYIPRENLMLEQLRDSAHHDLNRGHYGYAKERFEKILEWSHDRMVKEEAQLHLQYIAYLDKTEGLRDYYVPRLETVPAEIQKKQDFFNKLDINFYSN